MLQLVKNKLYSALGAAVHDKSQKQLFPGQEESQDNPFGFLGRMNGIHFCKRIRTKILKISKHAPFKNSTVLDLCFMYLTWFKLDFAFEVDISGGENTVIQIRIESPDRHIQFRMVCEDLIGGLPMIDQRCDEHIFLMKFVLCHVYTSSG